MSLSNLNKDNLNRLFEMLNITDENLIQENTITNIKSNYVTFSRLQLIQQQIDFLRNQTINILENHENESQLNSIKCSFRKST